ncbi:hypothetical protein HNR74_003761 [Flammeovirga kamogawensis]|nr:hypothetical protein [Flammeovirga kamogawensis]
MEIHSITKRVFFKVFQYLSMSIGTVVLMLLIASGGQV